MIPSQLTIGSITALLRYKKDVLSEMDNQTFTLAFSFDMSEAFGTTEHRISRFKDCQRSLVFITYQTMNSITHANFMTMTTSGRFSHDLITLRQRETLI